MIGHIKKNQESNLVALCEECHHKVHNGDLNINGYMKTTHGLELDYKQLAEEEIVEKMKSKKKYTEAQVDIIRGYKNLPNTSMKKVCILLEEKDGIKISSSTLKKIWTNAY